MTVTTTTAAADMPKIDRTDSSIESLPRFKWPATLDTDFTAATLKASQEAALYLNKNLATIVDAGTAAERRSLENFQTTIDLDGLPEKAREKLVTDAFNAAKKAGEVERARQSDIYKGVNEIHEIQLAEAEATLAGILAVAPNSAALLDVLSTSELDVRLRYEQLLGNASYAATLTHAKRALSCGNRAMAAAVLSRLQSMDRGSRPIGPNMFAEKIIGPLHQNLSTALAEVANLRANVATVKKTALTGKAGTPIDRIKAGLRRSALDQKRAEEELLGTADEQ